jgi:hypothetical protein
LEIASRLGQQAARREAEDATAPDQNLRDQITALLDQAYSEVQSQTTPVPTAVTQS